MSRRPMFYIVEHDYDGYAQRFSKIGNWKTVQRWARDGSIKEGEQVMAVYACRQPTTKKARGKG